MSGLFKRVVTPIMLAAQTAAATVGWAWDKSAKAGTVAGALADRIVVWDIMTDAQRADALSGAKALDLSVPINTALAYAYAFTCGNTTDWAGTLRLGSWLVEMPPGLYRCDSTIVVREGTSLVGAGHTATILAPTHNGNAVQLEASPNYNSFGLKLADFAVHGNRAGSAQNGVAVLRAVMLHIARVKVQDCGGSGFVIRQGLMVKLDTCTASRNAGHGLVFADGVASWGTPTPNGYPTNASCSENGHYAFNDGAGVKFEQSGTPTLGGVNGCRIIGGAIESNGWAGAVGTGYNVHSAVANILANEIEGVWFESAGANQTVKHHVYIAHGDISNVLRVRNCTHSANGTTGYPERFVAALKGTVEVSGCVGTNVQYRSVAGSVAPVRITKPDAIAYVSDCRGCLVSGVAWIEDQTGATTNLALYATVDNYGNHYGPCTSVVPPGGDYAMTWRHETDANPFAAFDQNARKLMLGTGAGALAHTFGEVPAGGLGLSTQTDFRLGGDWDKGLLWLGGYAIWPDASGRLRIKLGRPASQGDGTIVGLQS